MKLLDGSVYESWDGEYFGSRKVYPAVDDFITAMLKEHGDDIFTSDHAKIASSVRESMAGMCVGQGFCSETGEPHWHYDDWPGAARRSGTPIWVYQ